MCHPHNTGQQHSGGCPLAGGSCLFSLASHLDIKCSPTRNTWYPDNFLFFKTLGYGVSLAEIPMCRSGLRLVASWSASMWVAPLHVLDTMDSWNLYLKQNTALFKWLLSCIFVRFPRKKREIHSSFQEIVLRSSGSGLSWSCTCFWVQIAELPLNMQSQGPNPG